MLGLCTAEGKKIDYNIYSGANSLKLYVKPHKVGAITAPSGKIKKGLTGIPAYVQAMS